MSDRTRTGCTDTCFLTMSANLWPAITKTHLKLTLHLIPLEWGPVIRIYFIHNPENFYMLRGQPSCHSDTLWQVMQCLHGHAHTCIFTHTHTCTHAHNHMHAHSNAHSHFLCPWEFVNSTEWTHEIHIQNLNDLTYHTGIYWTARNWCFEKTKLVE